MRISLVTETFPPEINGVAKTLYSLAKGLVERGNEIEIIRPRQQEKETIDPELHIEQFSVVGLPLPGYRGLRIGLPSRSRLIRRWKKSMPEVIYIATEGPLGHSALRAAKQLELPVISGFHTNFQQYMMHYNLGLLKQPAELYLKDFHNKTLATFVPTEDTRDRLFEMGFKNLKLMGRGVDTRLFNPDKRSDELRASWGAKPEDPVVLYVGRIASEKNLPLFFKSIRSLRKKHPRLVAVVVGDGPERKTYESEHKDILFAGAKKGEELSHYYASADYFIFPSLTETFGNVVTEAMASGLIIVAYNYAAPRLYLNNAVNGFLVNMDEELDFIRKIHQALDLQDNGTSIKQAARNSALAISWDVVVDHFESDIKSIIAQENPSD